MAYYVIRRGKVKGKSVETEIVGFLGRNVIFCCDCRILGIWLLCFGLVLWDCLVVLVFGVVLQYESCGDK